jgi:hypothetical protein
MCGAGGDLFLCDDCDYAFCESCVEWNLPPGSRDVINASANWTCPSCDHSSVAHLSKGLERYEPTAWSPDDLVSTIPLLCHVEDQIVMCEKMNEPESWKSEEARIRERLEDGDR